MYCRTIESTIEAHSTPEFVTRLTRRIPQVEYELVTLPEHLRSPTVFSGVRVTRSLVYGYVL